MNCDVEESGEGGSLGDIGGSMDLDVLTVRLRAGYFPRSPAVGTWTVTMAVMACLPCLRDRLILGNSDLTEMEGTTTFVADPSVATDREELLMCIPTADSRTSSALGSYTWGTEATLLPLVDRIEGAVCKCDGLPPVSC